MINFRLLFCIILFIIPACVRSQIVLDTIINPWNGWGYDMYVVKISPNETKYYVQDTLTNTFNLYNLDFTPFMLNVTVPESFSPFSKHMEVIYLSRSLFDCDSTNIEYAYTSIGTGFNPFYIMRTDGTMLFKLDSAKAPYNFGALNGSQDFRPIINTEDGARLYIYSPQNSNNLHVYSLCGTLSNNLYSLIQTTDIYSSINIYPNPSTGEVTFQGTFADNIYNYTLKIFDLKGNTILTKEIETNNYKSQFNLNGLSSGTFLYEIYQNGRKYYQGKFILSK